MAAATKATGGYALSISLIDGVTEQINAINKRIAEVKRPTEALNRSMEKFAKVTGLDDIAKKISGLARGAADFARKLLEVIPVLGALGGATSLAGIYALATAFGNMGVRLGLLSARLGVTGTGLQQLENVAQQAHVPTAALDSGLQNLRDTMTDIAGGRGGADAIILLRHFGFSMADAGRFAKDPIAALPVLAEKLRGIRNPTLRAELATQLFGGATEQLLPLLNLSKEAFDQLSAKVARHGLITQAGFDAANDFNVAQTDVEQSVKGVGYAIAEKLLPVLTPMLTQLSEWIDRSRPDFVNALTEAVKQLSTWLQSLDWQAIGAGIISVATHIRDLLVWIWRWKAELLAVFLVFKGAQFAFALAQIGLMVAGYVNLTKAAKAAAVAETAAAEAAAGRGAAAEGGLLATLLRFGGPVGAFIATMWPSNATGNEAADLANWKAAGSPNPRTDPLLGGFERNDRYRARDGGRSSGAPAQGGPVSTAVPGGNIPAFLGNLEKGYGLAAGTLDRVWAAESSRGADLSTSPTGAMGHFQFEPDTAAEEGLKNPNDLATSAAAAADYLQRLAGMFGGDQKKALAAYNWGPGNLQKDIAAHGDQWADFLPAETAGYLRKTYVDPATAPVAGGAPQTVAAVAGPNAAQQKMDGAVTATVKFVNPPPGTAVTAATSGPLMAGPAKIETSLPSQAGP